MRTKRKGYNAQARSLAGPQLERLPQLTVPQLKELARILRITNKYTGKDELIHAIRSQANATFADTLTRFAEAAAQMENTP
jgi:hypothetical protein